MPKSPVENLKYYEGESWGELRVKLIKFSREVLGIYCRIGALSWDQGIVELTHEEAEIQDERLYFGLKFSFKDVEGKIYYLGLRSSPTERLGVVSTGLHQAVAGEIVLVKALVGLPLLPSLGAFKDPWAAIMWMNRNPDFYRWEKLIEKLY